MPIAEAALRLPPSFTLVSLREAGDAYAYACENAARLGAGTLVWARRFHLAEFAVVLEPEEPLRLARQVIYAGGNALANALSGYAPPQHAITMDWPDALRVDGALVGGVRLGWPDGAADNEAPDWLVLGCTVRTVVMRAGEAGLRPLLGGLDEQGFDDVDPATIVEGFSRYFLREMHAWSEDGPDGAVETWLRRAACKTLRPGADGEMMRGSELLSLAQALRATPTWLDTATGAPWL